MRGGASPPRLQFCVENRPQPRVLVADDEETIRLLVGHLLRRAGYEAVEVPDGELAIMELGRTA